MSEPHRQCASVLITDDENRILFIRQSYGMKFYGFPGGIVDIGETPPVAAIRETLEEVQVGVELEYQLGAYLLTGGGWPNIFASVYKARITRGTPKADPREISEVAWRRLDNLPTPLLPDTEAALQDFAEGRKGVVRTHQRASTMPEWVADAAT